MSQAVLQAFLEKPQKSGWKSFVADYRAESEMKSYLGIYFNFAYYVLLVPFKVKKSRKSGDYVLESNMYQKVNST